MMRGGRNPMIAGACSVSASGAIPPARYVSLECLHSAPHQFSLIEVISDMIPHPSWIAADQVRHIDAVKTQPVIGRVPRSGVPMQSCMPELLVQDQTCHEPAGW